jgi:type IV fimbrial biogenesis protein FimT
MKHRRSRNAGFTLVEMATTFALFAILTAAGAPSFRDFAIGQRIKSTSFDIYGDLVYARSEAIKANSEVVLAKATGGWKNGWRITWVDTSGTTRTLRSRNALDDSLALSGSLDRIRFERNGRLLLGTPAVKFTIDDTNGKEEIPARCIVLDPSGMPQTLAGPCA